jgi:hypothetical protein
MDSNQRANIQRTIKSLCDSLHSAWHYVLLLKSFQDAYHQHERMNGQYGRVVNQFWAALWDALFARIGTYYDRTPGTHSIPTLMKQLRRSKDPSLVALAANTDRVLQSTAAVTARFLRWRNEVVGHNSSTLLADQFNRETVVHIGDAELLLQQVEDIANAVSRVVSGSIFDVQHWNPDFAAEASLFLALVEQAMQAQATGDALDFMKATFRPTF